MQLEHINRADCAKLQASIEKRGAFNVADKARTWLKKFFSQAIARGGVRTQSGFRTSCHRAGAAFP
jgi:hypothetical protein